MAHLVEQRYCNMFNTQKPHTTVHTGAPVAGYWLKKLQVHKKTNHFGMVGAAFRRQSLGPIARINHCYIIYIIIFAHTLFVTRGRRTNTRGAACIRPAYTILILHVHIIPYNIIVGVHTGSREANGGRASCLSRTSRRLTGINPGEMTRLIKQIGQNIIGRANTVRSCPPNPLNRRTDLMSVCASINPSHICYCCRTANGALRGSRF